MFTNDVFNVLRVDIQTSWGFTAGTVRRRGSVVAIHIRGDGVAAGWNHTRAIQAGVSGESVPVGVVIVRLRGQVECPCRDRR